MTTPSPEDIKKLRQTDFRSEVERIRCEQWLIRVPRDEDARVFKKLPVGLTTSMGEFEAQLLGLTSLRADSLSDTEIAQALDGSTEFFLAPATAAT
jgi:hypothetical protein